MNEEQIIQGAKEVYKLSKQRSRNKRSWNYRYVNKIGGTEKWRNT